MKFLSFPEYCHLCRKGKRTEKALRADYYVYLLYVELLNSMIKSNGISFADCDQAPAMPCPINLRCVKKKDENPMSSLSSATIVTSDSIEAKQRKFITSRLYEIKHDLKRGLARQFGIADDDTPNTAKEFIDRIKSGKYILPENMEDNCSYSAVSYIKWRDPALKADKDGYAAAKKQLDDAYATSEEMAMLLPIADAAKALQDFKSWKYEAAASTPAAV